MRKCSVEGCNRKSRSRGFCNMHHLRWWKHGDPTIVLVRGGSHPSLKAGDHHSWKGEDVGYLAIHHRLKAARGAASEHVCPCGKQAHDWAFDEPTGFSTDLSRYTALCVSCHRRQDVRRTLL